MEISAASWAAVSLVCVSIILRWVWSVLDWVWFKPKKLERLLKQQGLQGNSYKFLYGDTKENVAMLQEASSKPMNLSTSHDIAPRVAPFNVQTVGTYSKDSFVWTGTTPVVNIMNPQDVKDVFLKVDDFRRREPNPLVKLLGRGLATYDGEKWVKHRRIINPAFHLEKLKNIFPAFHHSCDEKIKEWDSLVSKGGSSCELDVWPPIQSLTADVISQTAFGSSYEEGRKIFELLREQTIYGMKTLQNVYIPGWSFLPTKMNKRMKEIDREIKGSLRGIINKREQSTEAGEAPKDDLLGALLESSRKDIEEHGKGNKNTGMSIEDVMEECKLFYFAGQEATAVLLVWTMILLGQNQNWQDRAREEVLRVFGSNKPDFDGLSHLKVVAMILYEVLRLYPPFPTMFRVIHKKIQLEKFSLPAGVEVGIPVLLIHHDKDLWGDDANEFKPERFSEGVANATKNQISFLPFGGGPRICVGQNFAMIEVKLALALILQHFTFELSPSYTHAPVARAHVTIQPQFGAPLILYKR